MTRMRSLPYDCSQLFLYADLKVSPDWSEENNTLQSSTPTHDVQGKPSVLFVVVKEKQVKSDNIVEHERTERLTIGPAGRFCASHAPQLPGFPVSHRYQTEGHGLLKLDLLRVQTSLFCEHPFPCFGSILSTCVNHSFPNVTWSAVISSEIDEE